MTLNLGGRWEYSAPVTEKYGRLVNLDIAPGYTGVTPVVATTPRGALTGQHYSDSLVIRTNMPSAARRDRLASVPCLVVDRSRRLRRLLQHLRVSIHRYANGPAIAVIQELERAEQPQ